MVHVVWFAIGTAMLGMPVAAADVAPVDPGIAQRAANAVIAIEEQAPRRAVTTAVADLGARHAARQADDVIVQILDDAFVLGGEIDLATLMDEPVFRPPVPEARHVVLTTATGATRPATLAALPPASDAGAAAARPRRVASAAPGVGLELPRDVRRVDVSWPRTRAHEAGVRLSGEHVSVTFHRTGSGTFEPVLLAGAGNAERVTLGPLEAAGVGAQASAGAARRAVARFAALRAEERAGAFFAADLDAVRGARDIDDLAWAVLQAVNRSTYSRVNGAAKARLPDGSSVWLAHYGRDDRRPSFSGSVFDQAGTLRWDVLVSYDRQPGDTREPLTVAVDLVVRVLSPRQHVGPMTRPSSRPSSRPG